MSFEENKPTFITLFTSVIQEITDIKSFGKLRIIQVYNLTVLDSWRARVKIEIEHKKFI